MMLFYPHTDKQCDHCQRVIKPKQLVAVYGAFTYLCLQCYAGIQIETTSEESGRGISK